MAGATRTDVVREDTSGFETVAGLTVGLSALLFVLALAALFQIVSVSETIVGFGTPALLGGVLVLAGLTVSALGGASYTGAYQTTARASAGLVAASLFGLIWFVIGGLVASQTLGLGSPLWQLAALLVGAGGFALAAFPPEDIGSTLPAGALAVFLGGVLLVGAIGPDWSWGPANFPSSQQVTFLPGVVVPTAVLFSALVVGWAAAKAYGGFGARGRHLGAYMLIYLNAGAIIATLFGLVAFVFMKGFSPMTRGLEFGLGVGPATSIVFALVIPFVDIRLFELGYTVVWPVSWPFVMNGVSLFNEVNGIWPSIIGTVWLVIGATVMAVPLGVGSAIFLTEYAERGRFTKVVEVATNALWSTPSIVFGLFGAAFLIPRFTPQPSRSLLAGMLTLGFMLLPLVVITARESMLAVPDEYRDASAALGVSKWQTIRSVVLPAAMPGIVTGVILGVGRIAGETAPLLLTMTGDTLPNADSAVKVINNFQLTLSPPFITNPELTRTTAALPLQLWQIVLTGTGQSSGLDDVEAFGWGTALVLLIVVLSFYAIGIATRKYFRSKLTYE